MFSGLHTHARCGERMCDGYGFFKAKEGMRVAAAVFRERREREREREREGEREREIAPRHASSLLLGYAPFLLCSSSGPRMAILHGVPRLLLDLRARKQEGVWAPRPRVRVSGEEDKDGKGERARAGEGVS